jgi:putative colanic acid biosynthesis UDP-glucose lipid carrier transferase
LRFQKQRTEKRLNARALIVSGANKWEQMPALTETVQDYGYQVVGLLNGNSKSNKVLPFPVTGQVRDISNILQNNPVDEIFISYSTLKKEEVKYAIEAADYHGVRVNLVPETPSFLNIGFQSSTLDGKPVFQLRRSPLDRFKNYLIKKIFDSFFALAVLIILSPVYLLVAAMIYLEDRGPIFYRPVRKGEEGKTFNCYKFRTMSVCDDPVNGTKSTEVNDPRITRVGKFLRQHDLDELPQFLNVLLGDMSVVGPRPHRVFLQNDFRGIINEYMVRHYVKPGITGWAQVNGWRGPTKTIEQKKQRIAHDLWYIEHWNLWLDIKIIFLTVFGKKTRENAF